MRHYNVAQLRRLREQYPAELVVIGVHSAKFPSEQLTQNIRNAVMRHGIQHPVVNDAGLKIWSSYAVRAWPTLIIVDPRGRIAGEISGEILADDLTLTLDEIIREQADLIDRTPFQARKETTLEPDHLLRYPSRLLPVEPDLLYIADSGHHRVIETRLSTDRRSADVLRVFGSGHPGLRDGAPQQAMLNSPHGMAFSAANHALYVADTENHAIRKINLEPVRRLTGGTRLHLPPKRLSAHPGHCTCWTIICSLPWRALTRSG